MKRLIFVVSYLFFSQFVFAQVFYDSTTKKLRYAGAMKQEVMQLLTSEEKDLLKDCIMECGVNPDSVIWITKEVYDNTAYTNYYSSKMINKSTSNKKGNVQTFTGDHSLEKPQFLVFLDRSDAEFEVVLLMYY